jgi:hypothetical protein
MVAPSAGMTLQRLALLLRQAHEGVRRERATHLADCALLECIRNSITESEGGSL